MLVTVCLLPVTLKAEFSKIEPVKNTGTFQQVFVDLRFGMFMHFSVSQVWGDDERS